MSTRNHLEAARTAELKRKSLSVTASTIPGLFGLELVFYRINGHDTLSWVLIFLIAACSIFRFFHVRFSRQSDPAWRKTTAFIAFWIGVFWASFFYRTADLGRNQFFVQAFVFMAALGFSATSTYSLAIDKITYRAYLTPIMIAVGAIAVTQAHHPADQILGCIITALLYSVGIAQGNIVAQGWEKNQRLTLELQALIDSFPGGILVASKGSVSRANAYFHAVITEREPLDHLLDEPGFSARFREFTRNSQRHQLDFEAHIQTRSGERAFWFLLVRMEGLDPSSEEIIIVALDVQAKKDAEAQIESQRKKLEASSKLAALGEMAAGVAHEVNNPVFVITSRVQLMSKHLEKGSAAEQFYKPHFEVILKTCERIVKIVRGLSAISRSTENEPFERTSIRDIIEQAIDICSVRLGQTRARLEVSLNTGDFMVEARPVQLSQVFLNLLNNAFDAIEATPSPWIRVEISSRDDQVEATVSDSGPGVPLEIRPRIMESFFTTKIPGRGTGLGLSISSGIIKAHQGALFLDETSPHTRFVVRVPRMQGQSGPVTVI